MKSNNKKDKVHIHIIIDRELDALIRKKAIERYGQFRKGDLKRIIEEALIMWLGADHAHTQSRPEPDLIKGEDRHEYVKPSRTVRTVMSIVMRIRGDSSITSTELRHIIKEVAGADPRTVRKYENILFKDFGLITPVNAVMRPGGPVVIYRVNNDKIEEFVERYNGAPLVPEGPGIRRPNMVM